MKHLALISAGLFGLSALCGLAQDQARLPAQLVRDVRPISGTNATAWVCPYDSFELTALEIAAGQGAGTASTSTFSSVTSADSGSVTNRVGLPSVAAAGATNAANHSGAYIRTNAVPVTFFYGDTITQSYVNPSGSNGLFIVIGTAAARR